MTAPRASGVNWRALGAGVVRVLLSVAWVCFAVALISFCIAFWMTATAGAWWTR